MMMVVGRNTCAWTVVLMFAIFFTSTIWGEHVAPRMSKSELPFTLSKDSILRGSYLYIGDLRILESPPDFTSELADVSTIERCIAEGPEWLSWSEDSTTLQVTWAHRPGERVLTAYCAEGVIVVGGSRETNSTDGTVRPRAWIFEMVRDLQASPTKLDFGATYRAAGTRQNLTYRLNEVRAINPRTGRIEFLGTSESGDRQLLTAPFAVQAKPTGFVAPTEN